MLFRSVDLPHAPRVRTLLEAIQGASSKVLVIVPFKGIINSLAKELEPHYSCAVINGDVSQCDIQESSGLATVIHLIQSKGLPVPLVEFTLDDIVRSGLCAMWVRAFTEARI